jgi:hypothetical protein
MNVITDPCDVCDGNGYVISYSVADVSEDEEVARAFICANCDGSGWGEE